MLSASSALPQAQLGTSEGLCLGDKAQAPGFASRPSGASPDVQLREGLLKGNERTD